MRNITLHRGAASVNQPDTRGGTEHGTQVHIIFIRRRYTGGTRPLRAQAALTKRTGVLVSYQPRQRLRKSSVQPALRAEQPFYPGQALPARLEGRLILREGEVQGPSVAEVQAGIGHRPARVAR